MFDDWENDDWQAPVFKTEDEIRKLEEMKLIEEEDNKLSYDLFTEDDNKIEKISSTLTNNFIHKENEKLFKKVQKNISNQQLNEQKQKDISLKIKQKKKEKLREQEIFGESKEEDCKYSHYEDYFYD